MRGPPSTVLRRVPAPPDPGGDAPALPAHVDVAIIGGGVIGLSIGWRLLAAGLSVAILDRGAIGGGASLAATGMLAAAAEFEPGAEQHLDFARDSQRLWPGFAARLEAESGLSVDYRSDGVLIVAQSRDEVERLRFRHRLQLAAGLPTRWLAGAECRALEPALRPAITAGVFCPDDHQVDPPRVVAALVEAVRRRGGHILPFCAAEPAIAGEAVEGVETPQGLLRAGTVIAAGGAWTRLPEETLPLRPLRGQSLALAMEPGRPLLGRMVWTDEVHLAPKGDGTLVVGATMEERGFDDAVTAGGLFALLDGVRRVLPGAEELSVEAVWSGFRPTSVDDAPILGTTETRGLLVATGHHRNGYLLAPATAMAMAALVLNGTIGEPAAPFATGRFRKQEHAA
ncbi:glycine oxidase ThiO [Bosea sp. TWI1241]|uniref:glycine oxidase ThiO n=1 Tax=Bosea sp. TWI1241 TaxID=3148904 RepID=UPI00320B18C3